MSTTAARSDWVRTNYDIITEYEDAIYVIHVIHLLQYPFTMRKLQ